MAGLRRILPSGGLLTDLEDRVCYGYDASPARGGVPAAVALPEREEEAAALLELASREGIPVIPRGAGTGLSGGSVPLEGSLVVALNRMNMIREIETQDLLAVVQPGVITGEFQAAVEKRSLFYPPDPSSLTACTLGGNAAENAGGPRGLKYGVTGDYVLGLRAVLAGGTVLRAGGRTVKNVTGYDLRGLLVGSEGTLGIITELTLRLLPKPVARRTFLAVFPSLETSAEAVARIIEAGAVPAALELMDDYTIRCVEEHARPGYPVEAGAVLLIELDGRPSEVAEEAGQVQGLCRAAGALRVEEGGSPEDCARLWAGRRAVGAAVARRKRVKISEDATVPRSRVPEMVRRLREIARRHGLEIAVFGHAGDGNLHPNILLDGDSRGELDRAEEAVGEIFTAALELGGTLSGEHGIGLMKAPYLSMEVGEAGLEAMARIKKALDPAGILNPGKAIGGQAVGPGSKPGSGPGPGPGRRGGKDPADR
ncbi:MAG: FAD-binding protein [Firmicutes bacterium]|nr:FAD-binding protein [Bacillota bacterium]